VAVLLLGFVLLGGAPLTVLMVTGVWHFCPCPPCGPSRFHALCPPGSACDFIDLIGVQSGQ
jgi:hypothetical protein